MDESGPWSRNDVEPVSWLLSCLTWADHRLSSLPQETLGNVARSLVGVMPNLRGVVPETIPDSRGRRTVPTQRRRKPGPGQSPLMGSIPTD